MQLHREANLPTIKEFLHDAALKFFENAAAFSKNFSRTPKHIVREAVDYGENRNYTNGQSACSSDRTEVQIALSVPRDLLPLFFCAIAPRTRGELKQKLTNYF
jgi:hypothetical protein